MTGGIALGHLKIVREILKRATGNIGHCHFLELTGNMGDPIQGPSPEPTTATGYYYSAPGPCRRCILLGATL